jgi:hypothetical protein
MIHRGAYQTIEDVVEAALTAVEQRASPSFEDTDDELEALLLAGVNSPEIPEEEFWASVDQTTDTIIAEHKIRAHP